MSAVNGAIQAVRGLLELLDRDASAEQFAQLLTAAHRSELSEAQRGELGRAADLALRIRGTQTEHRRREAELAAFFDTADRRLFERAAVVTALMLRRSVAETEDRVRGELLTDLLAAPERDPAGLVARGRRVGVDLTAPHAVVIADGDTISRRGHRGAAARTVPSHSLVGTHQGRVVLLVPRADPASIAHELATERGRASGCPVTIGAAGPAAGTTELAAAHAEAQRCLRALLALGRQGAAATGGDLGFLGLRLVDRADVSGFVYDTLGSVLDYDKAARYRPGAHAAQLLRLRRQLQPHQGCAGRSRQRRGAAT